jgi:hypothetical protein
MTYNENKTALKEQLKNEIWCRKRIKYMQLLVAYNSVGRQKICGTEQALWKNEVFPVKALWMLDSSPN